MGWLGLAFHLAEAEGWGRVCSLLFGEVDTFYVANFISYKIPFQDANRCEAIFEWSRVRLTLGANFSTYSSVVERSIAVFFWLFLLMRTSLFCFTHGVVVCRESCFPSVVLYAYYSFIVWLITRLIDYTSADAEQISVCGNVDHDNAESSLCNRNLCVEEVIYIEKSKQLSTCLLQTVLFRRSHSNTVVSHILLRKLSLDMLPFALLSKLTLAHVEEELSLR